jgi:hypothetical protein
MDYPRIRAAPTGAGIKLMPGAEKGLVKFSFFPDLFPFLTSLKYSFLTVYTLILAIYTNFLRGDTGLVVSAMD